MKVLIPILAFLLLLTAVSAEPTTIVVNSGDWHDVYSGMLYGSLTGIESKFLVSQRHGAIILYSIPTDEPEVQIYSSQSQPFVFGYEAFMEGRGYQTVNELATDELNLELARNLTDITKFIIIDPAYGYNAISAAPYAVVSDSYVLFANNRNIGDVVNFLEERGPTEIILFGQLDRDVKDELAQFSPETVNEGNRFANNLAMVERYAEYSDIRQAVLTNGEFIEVGMLSGDDPVIFIGSGNVPDVVQNWIADSDVDVGILIGNELIGTATTVRRQLGISVFVKFAQGARTPQGAIAQVEDLDRFPMPSYNVQLEITNIVYNRATRSLEVTYRNPQDLAVYFKSTITIRGDELPITAGDETAVFLDKNEVKTVVYSQTTAGNPLQLDGESYTADLLTIFGESPASLEQALQAQLSISFVDVMDDTDINITDLYYDQGAGEFVVTIKNTGDVAAYVQPEIVDLIVNDEPVTVASEGAVLIETGKSAKIPVVIEITEEDFTENAQIRVRAYYGEREIALIKVKEKIFPLAFGGLQLGSAALYGGIILLIILLLLFLGTKKKCKHCGHANARGRKKCEKCHNKL